MKINQKMNSITEQNVTEQKGNLEKELTELGDFLRAAYRKKNDLTVAELKAVLEKAQLGAEKFWDGRPGIPRTKCAEPGCNYRRWPASQFCMYHVKGRNTFAARLRQVAQPGGTEALKDRVL